MRYSRARRLVVTSLQAIAIFAIAACSSSTEPGITTATVAGTYTLKTVDGLVLPAPAKDGTGAIAGAFTAGTVTLTTANTFTSTLSYTLTNGTTGSSPNSGSYSISGSTLTFTPSGGGSAVTAAFSGGNTLTISSNGQAEVFTK